MHMQMACASSTTSSPPLHHHPLFVIASSTCHLLHPRFIITACALSLQDFSAEELRSAGYTLSELRWAFAGGGGLHQLVLAGYSTTELREVRCAAHMLNSCRPMPPPFRSCAQVGFPIGVFKGEGYSVEQLLEGGFDLKEIANAGFKVSSYGRPNSKPPSSSAVSLRAVPVTPIRRGLPPRRPGDFLAAQVAAGDTKTEERVFAVKAQAAASDVQRIYRGHLVREEKKAGEREEAAQHAAAADMQRMYRGHRVREEKKEAKEREEAAKVRPHSASHSASSGPALSALHSMRLHGKTFGEP